MDPIRQAAILVAALDMDAADALLEQMPADFAAAVRNQVMELDDVDAAEEEAVIGRFLGRQTNAPVDALDLSDDLSVAQPSTTLEDYLATASGKVSPPDGPAPATEGTEGTEGEEQPFQFLERADEETLLELLRLEHPQTIALVLSHVAPEVAGSVLAELPGPTQVDVARRIVKLDEVAPHTLTEIEQGLHSLYRSRVSGKGQRIGWQAMRKIVASVDHSRSDLLQNLQQRDAELAAGLASSTDLPSLMSDAPRPQPSSHQTCLRPVDFHDLIQLTDEHLGKVLQRVDGRTLLLALAGASPEFMKKVYGQLPRDDAQSLRRQIEQQGTIRLRDVEEAQRRIGMIAAKLATEGQVQGLAARRLAMAA